MVPVGLQAPGTVGKLDGAAEQAEGPPAGGVGSGPLAAPWVHADLVELVPLSYYS